MGWKDDLKRMNKENKEGSRFKLAEGENYFRFMPAKDLKSPPYVNIRTHYQVGPDKASLTCGHDANGEGRCWICDVKIPELAASASRDKRMQAVALASKRGIVVQVSTVDSETKKFGVPKPWYVDHGGAKSASNLVMSLLGTTKRNYEDPKKGFNVTVERFGTGLNTTYGTPIADESPSVVSPGTLAQIKPWSELLFEYDEEDMKNAYLGRARKKRGQEDEEEESSEDTVSELAADDEELQEELPEEPEEGEELVEEEEEQVEEEEVPEYDETAELEEDSEPEYEEEVEPEDEPEPEPVPPPRRKPAPAPAKTGPAPARKVALPPARKVAPPPARKVAPPPARKVAPPPARKVAPTKRPK